MKRDDKRFVSIHKEGSTIGDGVMQILVDTQTGVSYLWIQSGFAGGLTPLLDTNGKPVLAEMKEY